MRYLIFVSLLFGLLVACSSPKKMTADGTMTGANLLPFWTAELMDSVKKNDFRLTFTSPKATLTGVYIVKQVDGKWKGTLVNEFGLKVFDFACSPKKCTLMNVIPFLDKWYIKKAAASDIQFIISIDNPYYNIGIQSNRQLIGDTLVVNYKKEKELRRFPDGTIQYTNYKRVFTYSLKKITI